MYLPLLLVLTACKGDDTDTDAFEVTYPRLVVGPEDKDVLLDRIEDDGQGLGVRRLDERLRVVERSLHHDGPVLVTDDDRRRLREKAESRKEKIRKKEA